MKEILNQKLANCSQTPYRNKYGDTFMAENGEQPPQKPPESARKPQEPRSGEEIFAKEIADLTKKNPGMKWDDWGVDLKRAMIDNWKSKRVERESGKTPKVKAEESASSGEPPKTEAGPSGGEPPKKPPKGPAGQSFAEEPKGENERHTEETPNPESSGAEKKLPAADETKSQQANPDKETRERINVDELYSPEAKSLGGQINSYEEAFLNERTLEDFYKETSKISNAKDKQALANVLKHIYRRRAEKERETYEERFKSHPLVANIESQQKGTEERKTAITTLLESVSPHGETLPDGVITYALEFDETLESLVNRIVYLPFDLDHETLDYSLGLNAQMNMEKIADRVTQEMDRQTGKERERIKNLKERINLAKGSSILFHTMNALVVPGELNGFVQTAEKIMPNQLNYLQRLPGVGSAMRTYEEVYDRYHAKHGGWIYPYLERKLHDDVFKELTKLNEAGVLAKKKLGDSELRLAYNVGRKFFNNSFRSAEKVATGTVPVDVEGQEKAKLVKSIDDAIKNGDIQEEARLRKELADANKRGKQRFSSFPLESAARIMNPVQLTIYRFMVAEKRGGLIFLTKAKKYFQEFLRHDKDKLGLNKIEVLGGKKVEEMEYGGVFSTSGIYSSWRAENFAFLQIKITVDGKETNLRDWFANHVYEIEKTTKAFKDAGKNQAQKTDAQHELVRVLSPIIDATEVGLGLLVKYQPFAKELGYEARKQLWEKILLGSRLEKERSNDTLGDPTKGNLLLLINYLSEIKIKENSGVRVESIAQIRSRIRPQTTEGNYWEIKEGKNQVSRWDLLMDKLMAQHQINIKKGSGETLATKSIEFTNDEKTLIKAIKEEGKKLPEHLADIAFPYTPVMNDAPFEMFDYTVAGAEFYRRRVSGNGDLGNYVNGEGGFSEVVDNPGGGEPEKVLESFHKLERGIESPQGSEDAQKRAFPLFEAWVDWIMTKKGQRHVLYKKLKEKLLKPTSEAQEWSGMEAPSKDEGEARKIIDMSVKSGILNVELADELKKKKNIKLAGLLWAFFRDMFTTIIPAVAVYQFGKAVASEK